MKKQASNQQINAISRSSRTMMSSFRIIYQQNLHLSTLAVLHQLLESQSAIQNACRLSTVCSLLHIEIKRRLRVLALDYISAGTSFLPLLNLEFAASWQLSRL